MASDLSLSSCG